MVDRYPEVKTRIRSKGKILLGSGLVAFLAAGATLVNSLPKIEGKVMDPVRERVCDFRGEANHAAGLGHAILGSVDCKLVFAARKSQISNTFSLETDEEVGKWVRFHDVKQSRHRVVDTSKARIDADLVTRIVLPNLTHAEGQNNGKGVWTVSGDNGQGIDISSLKFYTPLPDVSSGTSPTDLQCAVKEDDPQFGGCIDTSLKTGWFNGLPLLGADNNNNLARSILRTVSIIANDTACPVEQVLIPAFSEPGKPPVSAHEAMSILVRAHARAVASSAHGITPQNVDVLIDDSHPFVPGVDINQAYSDQAQLYSYMPHLTFDEKYCLDSTTFAANNTTAIDFGWIKTMGAERVPNGFNPATGQMESNNPLLRRVAA